MKYIFGKTSSMNIYEEVASVACLTLFRLWYKVLFLLLLLLNNANRHYGH